MGWIGPLIQLLVMIGGFFMNMKSVTDEQKKSYYLWAKSMGMESLVPVKMHQDLEKIFNDLDKE